MPASANVAPEVLAAFNADHRETFKEIEKFMHVLDDWVNETLHDVKENLPANFKLQASADSEVKDDAAAEKEVEKQAAIEEMAIEI